MEPLRTVHLGIVLFLLQVAWCEYAESKPCFSGFASHLFTFRVPRERLHRGTEIGKVLFRDCSGQAQPLFDSDDEQFQLSTDGTVRLMGAVTLDNGHKSFTVHAQDSAGMRHTAYVRVDLEHGDWRLDNTKAANHLQTVFEFPKSCGGLRRRKREWVIPPIRHLENAKGPFPKEVAQIKSSYTRETNLEYEISGEGANQSPAGTFTIDRFTGKLYVTRPLDREEKSTYTIQVKATSPVDAKISEPFMEVIVEVLDQNDNGPVFTKNPFLGSVAEVSKIDYEFMTVRAADADDPNTANADVRYTIVKQTPEVPQPNMFAINPVSGAIRVNADGLDRTKYPKYSLEIVAADMEGTGLRTTGTAIITVTDKNTKPDSDYAGKGMQLIIPQVFIPENDRGPFPKQIAQIKSSHSENTNMVYSIKGEGADQPPVNVFNVDRNTGWLSVTGPLDRELIQQYALEAHAVSDDGSINEPPMKIDIRVIDQNDNKPVFTQPQFKESVAETSGKGFEFMTVTATDADSENGELSYSIVSQDPPLPHPNMFEINPKTGAIKVNAEGLDSKKYPKYTLVIEAADRDGNGFTASASAVITVRA